MWVHDGAMVPFIYIVYNLCDQLVFRVFLFAVMYQRTGAAASWRQTGLIGKTKEQRSGCWGD